MKGSMGTLVAAMTIGYASAAYGGASPPPDYPPYEEPSICDVCAQGLLGCGADDDADGMSNQCEECPNDPMNDVDADRICGDIDNCPEHLNYDQLDADEDGAGDDCDACPYDPFDDEDSDGVCGDLDNCPAVENSGQADADGDGDGDLCDPDDDGDNVSDGLDNCPLIANPSQPDFDHDAIGDACDADVDDDGVIDGLDSCLSTPLDAPVDVDGCSIVDLVPCTLPPGTEWKNHGAYVLAVVRMAQAFAAAGLISPDEMDADISQAAASTCGM